MLIIVNWTLRYKPHWNLNWNSKCKHFHSENIFQNVFGKMAAILCGLQKVNSSWPIDAIWQHRSGSTLAQVMAWCLMAPSHYLNQCWFIISEVLWHSPGGNFMLKIPILNMSLKITNLRLQPHIPGTNELTHWGRDKMAAIFQTTFSNAFSWMKIHEFPLRFHWNLFPRVQLTKFQHWVR